MGICTYLFMGFSKDFHRFLIEKDINLVILISRSYISRIEKKAVMKLRLALLEAGEGPGASHGKKDL